MTPLEKTVQAGLDIDQLRLIIDLIDACALFILDHEHRVCLHNRVAQRLAGNTVEADAWLRGAHFHSLADKRILCGDTSPLTLLMGLNNTTSLQAGWLDQAGAEHAFEFRVIPVEPGRLWIVSVRDRTDDWMLGESLAQIADAPDQAANLFHVTHDLGNVFGIAQLAAQGLAGFDLPEAARGKVQDILDACDRGSALMDGLLDPAVTGQRVQAVVDVPAILTSTATLLGRILPKTVTLALDLPDGSYLARCERGELEAAILQVLSHMRKTILDGPGAAGAITLGLHIRSGMLEIVARIENGHISPDLRDTYFNRQRAMSGTGLGLVAAEAFARRAGGQLQFHHHSDGGLQGTLSLPQADHPETVPAGTEAAMQDCLIGYRILLVETDGHLRTMMTEVLRQSGANVATAQNGDEALYTLTHEAEPDVMITTPTLPGDVGFTELSNRVARGHPDMRVIIVTGSPDVQASLPGALSALVLRKPVHLPALRNAIRLSPPRQDRPG
ncbi:response regulator [Actibacterium sp. 188UL27-1]|uniref:response regulator n=1 Tax=Actibacterium sp. 188UL27-1 TaxID=2786961 RepID=UPI00195BB234|nr:response regulator [Actibacterium sp. 188UL27-1]MBM7070037.1 response regulator [Actibacterium sp. 188UL27-1]